jgi:hypothetical protein
MTRGGEILAGAAFAVVCLAVWWFEIRHWFRPPNGG